MMYYSDTRPPARASGAVDLYGFQQIRALVPGTPMVLAPWVFTIEPNETHGASTMGVPGTSASFNRNAY